MTYARRASTTAAFFVFMALIVAFPGAAPASDELPEYLAPDSTEGALWAAECVATPKARTECNGPALSEGKPGGLLTNDRFTLLLIDGRILARTCAALSGKSGRLKAAGFAHADRGAMTVFRLEEDCGEGWKVVDLPHSGATGGGAEGGDE